MHHGKSLTMYSILVPFIAEQSTGPSSAGKRIICPAAITRTAYSITIFWDLANFHDCGVHDEELERSKPW